MPLFKSNYLKNLSNKTTLNESRIRMFSIDEEQKFDIFLSHSFLDRDEVKGLYIELTNLGYTVYVDWIIDNKLDRNNVTKETASLIRKRLKNSKSLLLAVSSNAAVSKWMPWELGFVDGNTNRCAIIPVAKDNSTLYSFKRTEYLLLYPYIDKETIMDGDEELWVNERSDTYVLLKSWINGSNPYKR